MIFVPGLGRVQGAQTRFCRAPCRNWTVSVLCLFCAEFEFLQLFLVNAIICRGKNEERQAVVPPPVTEEMVKSLLYSIQLYRVSV